MLPQITIPKTSVASQPKPHTIYHITIRLPLRSFTITKRYSDFTALDEQLTSLVGAKPPSILPPKTYLASSVSNPQLTETRRVGLEKYLCDINLTEDARWRSSPPWRQFLNLPSSVSGQAAATLGSHVAGANTSNVPVTDPVLWLDFNRELKSLLQDARLELTRRDQSTSLAEQHDASASSKKDLVKASTLIGVLESGLQAMAHETGEGHLGEGELRRRKDLISASKNEREALEVLANSLASKRAQDSLMATSQPKNDIRDSLMSGRAQTNLRNTGRVLGAPLPETERTRELDNNGVLQLQQEVMQDQDRDLDLLLKSVGRQKQMGLEIGEELELQNEILEALDADVDRVDGKLRVVKKRLKKIS